MVKTAAEYQKAYRERKKARDESFLQKERARVKSYRKPIESLAKKDQEYVRDRNKGYSKKYRDRQKQLKQNNSGKVQITQQVEENIIPSTSEENTGRANRSKPTILVKLSFPEKRRNARKSDALKRAHSRIQQLNQKISSLIKGKNKWAKRCQRISKKINTNTDTTEEDTDLVATNEHILTPNRKTKSELRRDGVSPRKLPKAVVKKLVMSNAILDEIKASRRANPQQRKRNVSTRVVSGKILQKYKCMTMLSRKTGISMRELRREQQKVIEFKKRSRMKTERDYLKAEVIAFIERDDVSVMMPGKADAKVCADGEKRQIRILTDYMSNIHERFQAETQKKISLALFCKLRPAYIKLTSSMSRNTCLCSRHQNFAMKLKCLRSLGIDISKNPETVSKNIQKEQMIELLNTIEDTEVEFEAWRRVEAEGKKKMKIVQVKCDRSEFITMVTDEYGFFLNHVRRVAGQYSALKSLKENLPKDELIVQMDFAENFTCGTIDEIQSAYWNASTVTLHPVVVYFRGEDSSLEHLNFVFVSDVLHHNSTAVITIMKLLCNELRDMFSSATNIHYWTDSPTSQYRNRFIFDALLHYPERFNGFSARWNYFESGHGKGPCDGIGGVAKRRAGDAIKQGKACIQDAKDFFNWANSSSGSIKYRFYTTVDYENNVAEIQNFEPVSMPGTMKSHAVLPKSGGIFSREMSCYCQSCIKGEPLCDGWIWHNMTRKVAETRHVQQPEMEDHQSHANISTEPDEQVIIPEKDDFVAALYEGDWYIGKVLETDKSDGDAHISFMKKTNRNALVAKYKWPHPSDDLWLEFNHILCKINPPVPVGKSGREFKLREEDFCRIGRIFPMT